MKHIENQSMSRRALLKSAAALAGVATIALVRVKDASAGVPKASMQYQDHPKDGHECSTCAQYIPGPKPGAAGKCRVVAGAISPHGWCIAYTGKS